MEGIILKGYSGFYYVLADGEVWECALRGRHKMTGDDFLPGDRVRIRPARTGRATIEEVLPRTSRLLRPPVANVSRIVLVAALSHPLPDPALMDRILVLAEHTGIRPLMVLSKADLQEPGRLESMASDYRNTGYRMIRVSARTGEGIGELEAELDGQVSVFAGQSGVGKSSIMNWLLEDQELKTGTLGEKSRRGRHTTRHIELFPWRGGFLADTPGFSRLYLPTMEQNLLQHCFPEFEPHLGQCRFASCLHHREPDCRVKEAVEAGDISRRRYENYLYLLREVKGDKRYD